MVGAVRRAFFRCGWLQIQRVDAYVIVVGNVFAGGVGKTPTVIAIAKHLSAQGHRVGIISRGFGRSTDQCLQVLPNSSPDHVGDEPLLLLAATQLPIFVGRNRVEAARALLASHPSTQVIVCDDGLQHYRLYRDFEVCVFDNRGCGNGWLLPAGPLREPWPRQALPQAGQHADRLLVLHTGDKPAFAGHTARRNLSTIGVRKNGTRVALGELISVDSRPLMAIAGIAQPENFFTMLRAQGLPLAHTLALPDHYDFHSFSRKQHERYQLICTEKDASKLWRHAPDAVAVPLIQTVEPAFFNQLDADIAAHLSASMATGVASALSSPHGHQTT